ncbi:MAG TPA: barstar family protein [Pyrinomonadaceae bacterium]|nr:barstar family protein [Pyrinomonadaceae bacterium]
MANIRLNAEIITDWESFHETFKQAMGFPGYYGMNMDAWIDCMSCLDDADGCMTRFNLDATETLNIEIAEIESLNVRCPEIVDALIKCSALVNKRYLAFGRPPALALVFL